jgi:hypothetical protein
MGSTGVWVDMGSPARMESNSALGLRVIETAQP